MVWKRFAQLHPLEKGWNSPAIVLLHSFSFVGFHTFLWALPFSLILFSIETPPSSDFPLPPIFLSTCHPGQLLLFRIHRALQFLPTPQRNPASDKAGPKNPFRMEICTLLGYSCVPVSAGSNKLCDRRADNEDHRKPINSIQGVTKKNKTLCCGFEVYGAGAPWLNGKQRQK